MPETQHWRAEVLVATTWACNLRCTYCFVRESDLSAQMARMSPEMAVHVVDALDEALPHVETIVLHLYGGEPLTNLPALEAMVRRARDKRARRFSFTITTNGTVLSPEALALLDEGAFGVVLSIDGPAHVHDACRRTHDGAPTHAQVIRTLDALRKHTRCQVRGSSVVRSGWSLSQAYAYLRSLPVDLVKAQAVRAPAGAPWALSAEERATYLGDLEEIGRHVIADLEDGRMPMDDRYSSRVLQLLQGTVRETFCGAGETVFGITPTGDVLPCVLLECEGNRLGQISDVEQTWVAAGRRWRAARAGGREACATCDALDLCGGGCPAMHAVCGANECTFTQQACQVARSIYAHFAERPTMLLTLAGID